MADLVDLTDQVMKMLGSMSTPPAAAGVDADAALGGVAGAGETFGQYMPTMRWAPSTAEYARAVARHVPSGLARIGNKAGHFAENALREMSGETGLALRQPTGLARLGGASADAAASGTLRGLGGAGSSNIIDLLSSSGLPPYLRQRLLEQLRNSSVPAEEVDTTLPEAAADPAAEVAPEVAEEAAAPAAGGLLSKIAPALGVVGKAAGKAGMIIPAAIAGARRLGSAKADLLGPNRDPSRALYEMAMGAADIPTFGLAESGARSFVNAPSLSAMFSPEHEKEYAQHGIRHTLMPWTAATDLLAPDAPAPTADLGGDLRKDPQHLFDYIRTGLHHANQYLAGPTKDLAAYKGTVGKLTDELRDAGLSEPLIAQLYAGVASGRWQRGVAPSNSIGAGAKGTGGNLSDWISRSSLSDFIHDAARTTNPSPQPGMLERIGVHYVPQSPGEEFLP